MKNYRSVYIENNDPNKALEDFLCRLHISGKAEDVDITAALGRVTYEPHFAKVCDPFYNAAAMDGIMTNSAKTFDASELTPVALKLHRDFEYVNTGGEIAGGYDTVIMIEDVIIVDDDTVQIIQSAYPWQHVRLVGESIVAGEMILPSRRRIRPVDVGALVAGGYDKARVFRKPRVAIIPTGAELVDSVRRLEAGRLMESNSHVFAALTDEYGGVAQRYPIVRDNFDELLRTIKSAVSENDIVVINAGTSAGTKDHTLAALSELGVVHTHGIAVKPGKPTILAEIGGKPVLGVPGYPVSAYLMFEKFVSPLMTSMLGFMPVQAPTVSATLSRRLVSSAKNEEVVRVAVGYVHGKYVATPLERGASAVMSLVRADGKVTIPRLVEGFDSGEVVQVDLMAPLSRIENTLAVVGSHDLIIDILADSMNISSAHVGSMGGITAMKRGECHIAPVHLLDEDTGVYNIPFVHKYLSDRKMALIKGVGRVQGFIVRPDNPLGIAGVADIADPARGIRFANRQRGAGTRLLLDYCLSRQGIEPSGIMGYEKEFNTHLSVAVAVKSGHVDAGLGILSAAKAMGLGFVPVADESYDFLVPQEFLDEPRVRQFVQILKSGGFREQVLNMGGYTLEGIGEIVYL
ncbi:MAG: molybdopterin biosynthesis protein [Defluviitaleaceae bacterium]|nr:molybdopterin biosynthesis protein [Defluviitaleaceae bacterium]